MQTLPHHFLGGDFPNFKWQQIQPFLPPDIRGWRVLDVGCNAGFYSFELARRGASVLGIDVDPHYLAQATWAVREMGLDSEVVFTGRTAAGKDVRFDAIDVFDLAEDGRIRRWSNWYDIDYARKAITGSG